MKLDNFINTKHGKLTVIAITDKVDKYKRKIYELLCECGNITFKTKNEVINKRGPRSCGCIPRKRKTKDISGERFTKLVAVMPTGEKSKNGDALWYCECDCGKSTITTIGRLNFGHTKSCGCLKKDAIPFKSNYHGMKNTPEYNSWRKMKERCYDINNPDYKNYGAIGITMPDEWKDNFLRFYQDVGKCPCKGYTVDRVDCNLSYSKENCRWASPHIQARNRLKTKASKTSKYKGVSYDKAADKWSARFTISSGGNIYGGRIFRYETEEEAASAYDLATMLVFEGFPTSIYNLNNSGFDVDEINKDIYFFKVHLQKLKEIANLVYKD